MESRSSVMFSCVNRTLCSQTLKLDNKEMEKKVGVSSSNGFSFCEAPDAPGRTQTSMSAALSIVGINPKNTAVLKLRL